MAQSKYIFLLGEEEARKIEEGLLSLLSQNHSHIFLLLMNMGIVSIFINDISILQQKLLALKTYIDNKERLGICITKVTICRTP